jgi:hypothetical protein
MEELLRAQLGSTPQADPEWRYSVALHNKRFTHSQSDRHFIILIGRARAINAEMKGGLLYVLGYG